MPSGAGVGSAIGFLRAPVGYEVVKSLYQRFASFDLGAVNALLDEHIGHIATRIRELRALEKQLKALRAQCRQASDPAHCGILSGLTQPGAAPAPVPAAARHVHGVHGRGL